MENDKGEIVDLYASPEFEAESMERGENNC